MHPLSWLESLAQRPFARRRQIRRLRRSGTKLGTYCYPHCEILEDRELLKGGGGGGGGGGLGHAVGAMRAALKHHRPAHTRPSPQLAKPVQGQNALLTQPLATQVRPSLVSGKAVHSNQVNSGNLFPIGNSGGNTAHRFQNDRFLHFHHHHVIRWHYPRFPFRWWHFRPPEGWHFGAGQHHGWRFHHAHWEPWHAGHWHREHFWGWLRPWLPFRLHEGHFRAGRHDGLRVQHDGWPKRHGEHEHLRATHPLRLPVWLTPPPYGREVGEGRWGSHRWEFPEWREEHRPMIVTPWHPVLWIPAPPGLSVWTGHGGEHGRWDFPHEDWLERHPEHERLEALHRPPLVIDRAPLVSVRSARDTLHDWWDFHHWNWASWSRDVWFPRVLHWAWPPVIVFAPTLPVWAIRREPRGWRHFHHRGWEEPHHERWYLGAEHWQPPPLIPVEPIVRFLPLPHSVCDAVAVSLPAGSSTDAELSARDQFFAEHWAGPTGSSLPASTGNVSANDSVIQGTAGTGEGLDVAIQEWLRHKRQANLE